VQVQLHERHAVRDQHALEARDALDLAPGHRRVAAGVAHRRAEEFLIPAGVHDGDASLRRHDAPVAPQRRPLLLHLVGLAKAVHRDELGIEPAEQLVHHLAAARGRDAGDDHDDRARPGLAQLELRVEQPVLQLRQLVLVLELRQAPSAECLVQHGRFPASMRACARPAPAG
jgi:hypothetical protein